MTFETSSPTSIFRCSKHPEKGIYELMVNVNKMVSPPLKFTFNDFSKKDNEKQPQPKT